MSPADLDRAIATLRRVAHTARLENGDADDLAALAQAIEEMGAEIALLRDAIRRIEENWEHGDLADAVNWAVGLLPTE
jgi:hypothetical protein